MRTGILTRLTQASLLLLALTLPAAGNAQATADGRVLAVREATLKPGASAPAFEEYYRTEYAPPREAAIPGLKFYLIRAERGERKDHYLIVWEFDSVARRDEYFPVEGGAASERLSQLTRSLAPHRLRDFVEIGAPTDYVVLR